MVKSNIHFSLFLFVLFFLFNLSNAQTISLSEELNQKFTSTDLISDLDFILEKISHKEFNRDPYNFISESDFNQQVKNIKEYILKNDSLSRIDFFKKVGPLLTLLKDDHTLLKLGHKEMYAKLKENISKEHFMFLLSTIVFNGSCYVAASDTIPIKSRIISVNGIPITDIIRETLMHTNFSEYFAATKNIITSFDFPKYAIEVWSLYNFENEVEIKYVPYGKENEEDLILTLHPYLDKALMKTLKIMTVKMDKNPSLEFKDNLAVLRLPSFFAAKNINEGLKKWFEFFDKNFSDIISKNPKKLLIDISNNGGGSELVGFILLNYLYEKKIKTSFYSQEGTPAQIFEESIMPIIRDSSINIVKFNKFNGEVNLLISEMTFSAAARFADLFKTFLIGKIIGRETKGFRSHYGEAKWYELEKTGLGVQISSKFLVSASGDLEPHGVVPDYEIKINNVDDLFDRFGNDFLLNEAIKYLSN